MADISYEDSFLTVKRGNIQVKQIVSGPNMQSLMQIIGYNVEQFITFLFIIFIQLRYSKVI